MDVNLRKTATDTAYIVVGVGVLGFQQAQVRRRDAAARVNSLRRDASGTLRHQTDRIKARTEGCAANLTNLGSTFGSNVGSTVGSTVSNTVGAVSNTVGAVGSQVKAGADAARTADPRSWVDPVFGDLRVRVEPVVEQLRTIALPGTVSSLPDHVSKVIDVGRNRVQGRWGGAAATTTPIRSAANGA